jgi:hypothetical protein
MLLRLLAVLALVFALPLLIVLGLPKGILSASLALGCCKVTQHELH